MASARIYIIIHSSSHHRSRLEFRIINLSKREIKKLPGTLNSAGSEDLKCNGPPREHTFDIRVVCTVSLSFRRPATSPCVVATSLYTGPSRSSTGYHVLAVILEPDGSTMRTAVVTRDPAKVSAEQNC